MNNQLIRHKLFYPSVVVILSLLFAYFIFKGYVFHPNQYMFAFGGDALVIYYDMIFHVCHDKGSILTGMNYPFGEYIYLTDMQGAVTRVLQWINGLQINVCDCIPGIVHGLNIYLLPVATLLVFFILKYFNVRNIIAALFAVLIVFLSPQIIRFGGHFGLAYPMVIPMVIWWLLRKHTYRRLEKRDLLVLGLLIFFTFNNPYVGFSAAGFLICAAVVYFMLGIINRPFLKNAWIIGSVGLLAVLIPFVIFYFNDPVDDRIKQQWGFFYYHATLEGIFFPPDSLLYNLLKPYNWIKAEGPSERWVNLGIVGSLLLLVMFITWIIQLISRRKSLRTDAFYYEKLVMVVSALMMLIYAMNTYLFGFSQEWLEKHLGAMLMFKASGRIAWSFYFVITILGIVFLDKILQKIKSSVLTYSILFILAIAWAIDIHEYVAKRFKDSFHDNFFRPSFRKEILDVLDKSNITIADYQAMLVLPKMMSWSDVFISDIHWSSQFYSMRLSAATGLPMINAMLSRISTGQAADAIQMLSHPAIERELLKKLPDQKDIMLLLGGNHPPLTTGEQYLVDISSPLYLSNDFSLYKLRVNDLLESNYLEKLRERYHRKNSLSNQVVHHSFDDSPTNFSFYGKGAKLIPQGNTTVFHEPLSFASDTQGVFSAWIRIDYIRPVIGEWEFSVTDSTDQVIFNQNVDPRRSNDIQDMWIRLEVSFPSPKGSTLKVIVRSKKELYIDEISVYPYGSENIFDLPEQDSFLFNGYKVRK